MNESTKRVLLITSLTLYGSSYLDQAENEVRDFLGAATQKVLFVPYALLRLRLGPRKPQGLISKAPNHQV